jgi:translation elongation factor EF-Tu-like GTPase
MTEDKSENAATERGIAPFLLEIEDRFYSARDASVAVYGRVARGTVDVGAALDLVGFAPEPKHLVLRNIVASGSGELLWYLLEGVTEQEVYRGQVLAAPGSVRPATRFQAEVVFDERYEHISQQPCGCGACSSYCTWLGSAPVW